MLSDKIDLPLWSLQTLLKLTYDALSTFQFYNIIIIERCELYLTKISWL